MLRESTILLAHHQDSHYIPIEQKYGDFPDYFEIYTKCWVERDVMGNKILVWCCIVGIGLGFLVPLVFKVNQQTSLMIGMAGGLAVGYLLDIMREKKKRNAGNEVLSKKAQAANALLERARAEVSGESLPEMKSGDETFINDENQSVSLEEEAEKLNNAEELLRKAREKLSK